MTNGTLADNTAAVGGGFDNQATATITDSTLYGNSAEFGGGLNNLETLNIGTTIVADSTSGDDCHGPGTTNDLGYNLADDESCSFTATGDLSDTPSGLDPSGLQYNGGPTQTIALEPGSVAIDHVSNASKCPSTDQRGAPRTVPCDIGAYDTDWGPAIDIDVSGTQTSGGTDDLTYTTNAPPGTVSGTLVCTTLTDGSVISPGLGVGEYTVEGSSCSGLSSSDQAAYPIFASSYMGVTNGFEVLAPSIWSVATSPDPSSTYNEIFGVSCRADGDD